MARGDRPNLVLVTVDSLRADHCGAYEPPPGGADWDGSLTPTLDELAEGGVVFERAVAPGPRTPSSVPPSFTGAFLRPGVYGSWAEKTERWRERRARIRRHMGRHRTLAERLRDRGYATAAVTANPWTTRETGFDAGFDEFTAIGEDADVEPTGLFERVVDRVAGTNRHGWLLTWQDYYADVLAASESLAEPYFLWVFLLDPHQPYVAPRRCREETTGPGSYYANYRYNRFHAFTDDLPRHLHVRLERSYRDAIRSSDGFLARLRDDLADDDPVLVVHSDHGEAFREHGVYSHRPQLYEENVRVPLVVGGGDVPPGRVAGPTSLRRLPAMLADLADRRFDPDEHATDHVVCRTEEGERTGVRTRDWKYVRGGEDWPYVRVGEPRELYDLRADPGERANLAPDRSDGAAAFDALLDASAADLAERAGVERRVRRLADEREI